MRYPKEQEYRLRKKLESLPFVEVVKYYGNREKFRGDFLVRCGENLIRIEHKSTRADKIRLQYKWWLKVYHASVSFFDEEGASLPIVTFSFKGKPKMYAWTSANVGNTVTKLTPSKGSLVVNYRNLKELKQGESIYVFIRGNPMYILQLDDLLRALYVPRGSQQESQACKEADVRL